MERIKRKRSLPPKLRDAILNDQGNTAPLGHDRQNQFHLNFARETSNDQTSIVILDDEPHRRIHISESSEASKKYTTQSVLNIGDGDYFSLSMKTTRGNTIELLDDTTAQKRRRSVSPQNSDCCLDSNIGHDAKYKCRIGVC